MGKALDEKILSTLEKYPLPQIDDNYEIKLILDNLGLEYDYWWYEAKDKNNQKNHVAVLKRIIELATTGNRSHLACKLYEDTHLVDIEWVLDIIETDKSGYPSTVAFDLLCYRSNRHPRITASWFKKIVENATSGFPAVWAVHAAKAMVVDMAWAKNIVEKATGNDKNRAARELLLHNIAIWLENERNKFIYKMFETGDFSNVKYADPTITYEWYKTVVEKEKVICEDQ